MTVPNYIWVLLALAGLVAVGCAAAAAVKALEAKRLKPTRGAVKQDFPLSMHTESLLSTVRVTSSLFMTFIVWENFWALII